MMSRVHASAPLRPGYSHGRVRPLLFAILLLSALWPRFTLSTGSPGQVDQFMACFAGNDCVAKRTAWEHLTDDLPSCLTAARAWWSAHPRGIPVTLVTQLSVERLDQLRAQCAVWRGPLAAALYLPLFQPNAIELNQPNRQKLQAMVASADELFKAAELRAGSSTSGGGGCQLRLVLLYELFADPNALVLYPVNTLRNYARLLADTDLITNIDVDMLPSRSISDMLANAALRAEYEEGCRRGAVYVWPAFETHCGGTSYADGVALSSRGAVPAALKKCLRKMRPKAPFSHNATNYDRWLMEAEAEGQAAAEGRAQGAAAGGKAYPITYSLMFEPWFLSWRWGTLWYDYRYRGYGKNKIVQAAAMNSTGTTWFVSPHGFLVHRPHTESRARRVFLKDKFSRKDMETLRGGVYEHVESLWAATRVELQEGRYLARVERDFRACMEALPWWRREGGKGA